MVQPLLCMHICALTATIVRCDDDGDDDDRIDDENDDDYD